MRTDDRPITPFLLWGETANERMDIATETELESAIDYLTQIAEATKPFTVLLPVNEDTGLEMIVGLEISSLSFYSATDNPQYMGSLGPWSDDEWIAFLHQGEYSEIPRKHFVPIEDAREALRQYFRTGLRPDNVSWG